MNAAPDCNSAVDHAGYARRFRSVVDEHARSVARTLRYVGLPAHDLDDAVQEVFVTLHRRWSDLSHDQPLGPWLRGVALHVARNRRRVARRAPVALLEEPVDPRGGEAALVERQRAQRLLQLLSALPDEEREALVLFEIEALSMKDVAVALGVSLPTAYRRVESARAGLKKAMAKEER